MDIDPVGSNAGALLESVDVEATILACDLVGDEVTDLKEDDPGVLLPLLVAVVVVVELNDGLFVGEKGIEETGFFKELLLIKVPEADDGTAIELWKDSDLG